MESLKRSLIKAFTWRILATAITVVVVTIITGHLPLALGVGGVDALAKMVGYFLHERFWAKVEI